MSDCAPVLKPVLDASNLAVILDTSGAELVFMEDGLVLLKPCKAWHMSRKCHSNKLYLSCYPQVAMRKSHVADAVHTGRSHPSFTSILMKSKKFSRMREKTGCMASD